MLAGKLVHVVDDDFEFLQGVRRLLAAHGLKVETFSSPEAYQLEAHPYEAVCLILDIHLGRVSGIELLGQLSQSGVSTPVVLTTADDRDQTRQAALDAGCSAFLQKPFSAAMLMEALQRAADQASTYN
jgi:FixJ family two-component response regulator